MRTAQEKKRIKAFAKKCLDGRDFNETMAGEYMDGSVNLSGYKSAVILEVRNGATNALVWLRDRDFDRLIGALTRAKRAWYANKGPIDGHYVVGKEKKVR